MRHAPNRIALFTAVSFVMVGCASDAAGTTPTTIASTTSTATSTSIVSTTASASVASIVATSVAPTTDAPTTSAPTTDAPTTSASAAEAATTVPDTAVDGNDTLDGNVTFGDGTVNLADPSVGLASLASFRATLTITFTGTADGTAAQWTKTYELLSSTAPPAIQLTLTATGSPADAAPRLRIDMGGTTYERVGADPCTAAATADVEPPGDVQLADYLAAVFGADEQGADSVNGIATDHATFDEHALGQAGVATSIGEVWTATDGGYVVRYTRSTVGDATFFGDGVNGTLTWEYDVSDIDQPASIVLPDDCPVGLVDATATADATNLTSVPSALSFDTASTPADVIAFYQGALPGRGWIAADDPNVTEASSSSVFTRDGLTLTVFAAVDGGVTFVQLLVSRTV